MPAPSLLGPGLTARRLRIADSEVVLLRAIVEAYDGLAALYGDGSGCVLLTTTVQLTGELDRLLADLEAELSFERLS